MLVATHIITTLNIMALPLTVLNVSLTQTYIYLVMASLLGTLLPDIDEPDSTIGKRFPFLAYPINIFFGHRTITHNIVFAVTVILIGYAMNSIFIIGLGIGIVSHIIGDSITLGGINGALFPIVLSNKKFALLPYSLRFKVGSVEEYIVFISLFILFIYQMNHII